MRGRIGSITNGVREDGSAVRDTCEVNENKQKRTEPVIARETVDSHGVETKEENIWIVYRTNASTAET